jgi:hypothetical protein
MMMGSQGAQDVCTKFNLCFPASESITNGRERGFIDNQEVTEGR